MMRSIKRFVPPLFVSLYHYTWALFGAMVYGFPSRRLMVIGVTGTNGKSSVVWLTARMLEAAGFRVAAASSIEFQIAERHFPNMHKMTMPGRMYLQRLLRDAVRAGCSHAVIEATSEGVLQHRHRFIGWDVMVFTNLSPEHVERHGSYEKYRAAKGELFASLKAKAKNPKPKTSVINLADAEAGYFLRFPADRVIGFRVADAPPRASLPPSGEELVADDLRVAPDGIAFSVRGVVMRSPLRGRINIENSLAAIAASYAAGATLDACARGLREITAIPGRLEEVAEYRGARVIVDYAHNPAALQSLYDTVLTLSGNGYLTCVLGAAGGGRDRWKRPELGKIAARACDRIVVTDEDPYDEDPAAIRQAVIEGVKAFAAESRVEDIADRRLAIRRALTHAVPGGTVVISGKGCEPWMMLARGKKLAWDDRAVVREEIAVLERQTLNSQH